jgi:hypothetical protein
MKDKTYQYVRNKHIGVPAIGWALDGGTLIYLSAVGHKTALKAIWATVVGGNTLDCGNNIVAGQPPYRQLWKDLPDYSAHHMVIVAETAIKPEEGKPFYVLAFNGDNVERLFAHRLNQALAAPVLPEWGEYLLSTPRHEDWLIVLESFGDCVSGWRVDPTAPWNAAIGAGLQTGDIKL